MIAYWLETCWLCLLAFLAGGVAIGLVRGYVQSPGTSDARATTTGLRAGSAPSRIGSRSEGGLERKAAPETPRFSTPVIGLDPQLAQASYPIEEIEGIGPAFGRALRAMGIETTLDLLDVLQQSADSGAVAAGVDHDDVDGRVVGRWRNMAELCQIKGIRGQFAELLEFVGVGSIVDLAQQDADDLLERITELNRRENRSHELPLLPWVADWIAQARDQDSSLVFAEISAEEALEAYEVEEIEGIGPGYGRRLRAMGIQTTLDLLERGRDAEQRLQIARGMNRPDVDDRVVNRWVSMADLMRVEGIMGQFAELLNFSGIESVDDLGKADAGRLLSDLKATNERENRVPELPVETQIRGWIERAGRPKLNEP